MKAFDQNSIGLTDVLVHRAIFKRKMVRKWTKVKPNWIYSKQAGMNEWILGLPFIKYC